MLIVKPYGRSAAIEPEAQRKLRINNHELHKLNRIESLPDFASSDPRILIAQWIAVLDKIVKKPGHFEVERSSREIPKAHSAKSNNDETRTKQLDIRTALGKECWALLEPYLSKAGHADLAKLKKIWEQKLHPYGFHYSNFKNYKWLRDKDGELVKKNFKPVEDEKYVLEVEGRWFERFAEGKNLYQLDCAKIAGAIRDHLHSGEYLISDKGGKNDGKRPKRGLIETRAKSISENTLAKRMAQKLSTGDPEIIDVNSLVQNINAEAVPRWSEHEEQAFLKAGDVAAKIYNLALAEEHKGERLSHQQAAKVIFEHYGRLFTNKNGYLYNRQEIAQNYAGLLRLYDDVRAFYRVFLKNSRKGRPKPKGKRTERSDRNTALSVVLPRDHQALVRRLGNRNTNSITNDLIRIGRVLHYESTSDDGDGFGLTKSNPVWTGPISAIAESRYWNSDNQANIKRTEAFVRVWRNTIVQAARTARTFSGLSFGEKDRKGFYADPLDRDVAFEQSSKAAAQSAAERQATLLFGKQARLFLESEVDPTSFLFASLRLIAKLRNEGVHFKGRKTFVQKLKTSFSRPQNIIVRDCGDEWGTTLKAIQRLLQDDVAERNNRLLKDFEGAGLNLFATADSLKGFIEVVACADTSDLMLPKFNILLERLKNTDMLKLDNAMGRLPEPASQFELVDDASRARYVGLKALYETAFRVWAETIQSEALKKYAARATQRGTAEAREINSTDRHKDLIEARTAMLPRPKAGQTLALYMDEMQAAQASEMRIQNGYESDSEAARTQSKWIENYRRDIIGQAFADYLVSLDDKVRWLTELEPGRGSVAVTPMPNTLPVAGKGLTEDWISCVYYVLHFVPIDDVSRLLHQFRKWGALESKSTTGAEAKTGSDEDVTALRQALTLYLDMKDDKHDGEGMATFGLAPVSEAFFDSDDEFETAFKTEGSSEDRLGATRRGLREILRYGHLDVMTAAASFSKVSREDISRLSKMELTETGSRKGLKSRIALAQHDRKVLHKEFSVELEKAEKAAFVQAKKTWTGKYIKTEISRSISEKEAQKIANLAWSKAHELPKLERYAECLATIREHKRLTGKVRLTNYTDLHQLMTRIVSRLVDYAGLWERDGYFIALALLALQGKKPMDVFGRKAENFCKQGHLPYDVTQIDPAFLKLMERFHSPSRRDIRNSIDHFSFMSGTDVDLTSAVNDVRDLMGYDRKLKNAVAKSIKELVWQHGLELEWTMDARHRLRLQALRSRSMTHLAKNRKWKAFKTLPETTQASFTQPFHEDAFVAMARQLFIPNTSD